RSVIDHDQLKIAERLRQNAPHRLGDEPAGVVQRNDNRNRGHAADHTINARRPEDSSLTPSGSTARTKNSSRPYFPSGENRDGSYFSVRWHSETNGGPVGGLA